MAYVSHAEDDDDGGSVRLGLDCAMRLICSVSMIM